MSAQEPASPSRFIDAEARGAPDAPKKPKTSRRWTITSFKEAEPKFDADKMQYLIYQREKCPESGRLHWQGFVVMKTPQRLVTVKTLIGDDAAHLEIPRGDDASNIAYCSKEDSRVDGARVIEHGEAPKGQGSRTDLHALVDAVRTGRDLYEFMIEHPSMVRHVNHALKLQGLSIGKSVFNPRRKIITLYGPAGCGKTRLAHHIAGGSVTRVSAFSRGSCWFDGCHGAKIVLIDDFDPANAPPLSDFKQVLDSYSLPRQSKGSFVCFNPDIIIITTNYPVEQWYPELDFHPVTKMPLSEAAAKEARDVITRRIMPNYRDCYKVPITSLDFHLSWDNVEGGNPVQLLKYEPEVIVIDE